MKKLLYIILLLPLWVNAQTNGTIQKTSATGTIRGSFGSLGLDTLTRVTGALVDGYILKYHAATNKWYASPDGYIAGLQDSLTKKANRTFDNVASGAIAKAKVDTSATGLQTVSNFFPKGDTRYQRLSNQLNGTGIVEMSGTTPSYLSSTGTGNVVKATSPTLVTPNIGAANGSSLQLNNNSLASTVTTSALDSRNSTPATNVQNQNSPGIDWSGAGWNTSGLTSEANQWRSYNVPTSGNPSAGSLRFAFSRAGAAFADKLAFTSDGNINGLGANFTLSATGTGAYAALYGNGGGVYIGGGTSNDVFVANSGVVKIANLAGTGTRMAVVNNLGEFSTQAIPGGGGGAVTGVAVASANGFSGTSDGATVVPTITLTTSINSPVLAGNGTAISAATTTGSGSTVVLATSPTLTTPNIGAATASSLSVSGNLTGTNATGTTISNSSSGAFTAVYGNTGGLFLGTGAGNWISVTNAGALRFNAYGSGVLTSDGSGNVTASTGYAPLASPALTGNPTAPTQTAGDNSTKIATTAYVDAGLALKLNLSGGTLTGGLNGTTATFSGDVTANSDSTLKKNIKPLVSISTALRNIGAYSYDWKSNDAHAIGLIAQEVQKYFPELVKIDDKGILSMNYQNFTAVLLAGWKDLDERITKLEQK